MARAVWLAAAVLGSVPAMANGQAAADDLFLASLEELMDVRVTSVARKSQRAEDAAAAIYVITRNDIRQSGLTSLPEILRLAPGVQVAQIGASEWAVSIRGFNDLLANKLLVLVDGRSVYTRGFSGVFWDFQSMMVSDIDRIEIVRGPGGAVWGANAVNGVINIITRPALDTQGLVGEFSAGTFERDRLGVRYGGIVGRTAYRAFSQLSGQSNTQQRDPNGSSDHWRSLTSGVRLDWLRGTDALVVQADFRTKRTRPGWQALSSFDPRVPISTDDLSRGASGSVLGRWTRTNSSGNVLQVQAFHSTVRIDDAIVRSIDRTNDVDAQYETRLGDRHGVVFGGGYRHVDYANDDSFTMHLGSARIGTLNLFVQDEIPFGSDLTVTVGTKLEHDTFAGWGQAPSVRALWELSPHQRLWASASRARRTPAIGDRDRRINVRLPSGPGLPLVLAVLGDPQFRAEHLVQTEVGYRLRVGTSAVVESTVFTGSYSDLESSESAQPTFESIPVPHLLVGAQTANLMHARASGVEVNGQWRPMPRWQLDASYTWFQFRGGVDPTSLDVTSAQSDGGAPAHQWQIRSAVSVTPKLQVSGWVSRVGRLRALVVPAYTRLDARTEYKLSTGLTVAVVAQNLLSRHHSEFPRFGTTARGVPRSARVELRWTH